MSGMDCGYFESNSSISLTQVDLARVTLAPGVIGPWSKCQLYIKGYNLQPIQFGLYMLLTWWNTDLIRTSYSLFRKNVTGPHTWSRHMAAKLDSVNSRNSNRVPEMSVLYRWLTFCHLLLKTLNFNKRKRNSIFFILVMVFTIRY